ncbi:MAG: sodium-dependent transporter [Sphingomonadales bacterium]|jgi:NSS family neurotransmitter:Na+ symporter
MALKMHEKWSSRWGFMFAAMGAAVGLGNLWRFPFIAGENGGGAFVLVYVVFVFLLCIPIMVGELLLGRLGGESAVSTMRMLIARHKTSRLWNSIGWLSILIPFVGLSYYAIVAGWSFFYGAQAALGAFEGLDGSSSASLFGSLINRPWLMVGLHSLFIVLNIFIIGRGVKAGIEAASKILMPALFVLLILLVLYGAVAGDFARAYEFLLVPDFSKFSAHTLMAAMGQAFFSVAIGVGAMITYGAYLQEGTNLTKSAALICSADTIVAMLAGFAIFPIVFANGLAPTGGPPLIFITLPIGFGGIAGGQFLGVVFFVLLFFAAFTSSLGMLEPVVCWLEEHISGSRLKLAAIAGGAAWLVGLLPLLSFNELGGVRPLSWVGALADKSIFDSFDFIISTLLLPINGLLIALFAGWIIVREESQAHLGLAPTLYRYWHLALRIFAPLAVLAILWNGLVS